MQNRIIAFFSSQKFLHKKYLCTLILLFILQLLHAQLHVKPADSSDVQQITSTIRDTLSTVTITAFQSQGKWQDVPVAISLLDKQTLQFTDGSSLVSAFNTAPGVRFEQRSPGSYRLSIRGSLLRSPYGVRNIKVYWDGVPLTDAGGNTYLQLISPDQLSGAEIIKGPASSLYGASTGGAVILHSPVVFSESDSTADHFGVGVMGGSHGLINPAVSWQHSSSRFSGHLSISHLGANGTRAQDTMRRDVLHWNGSWLLNAKQRLDLISFYSDLHYQTPGGITAGQLGTDTTAYPLAVKQKAAVKNKTLFGAATLHSKLSAVLDNQTALLWSHTGFENPFTSNYEKRQEYNYGGRTVFTFHKRHSDLNWDVLAGMEWLAGHAAVDNFGNMSGRADTVQYKDRLQLEQRTFFIQGSLLLGAVQLQAGLSANQQIVGYKRLTDPTESRRQTARSDYLWSPRLGLNYRLIGDLHFYAIAARGFSTPTLAEIHPSDGSFNKDLQPEGGWNLEGGLKGTLLASRLQFDGSLYRFGLKNAIVRRSSATVDEYYVNAGSTRQQGAELWLNYELLQNSNAGRWLKQVAISSSLSYQPYRFLDYQVAGDDFQHHPVTGVPKNVSVFTLNMVSRPGFYLHALLNCTSQIPVNDASTAYASSYQLLQAKAGYRFISKGCQLDLYIGMDNILDQRYSLGSDINAYGKRFFNPAPGRNGFAGVSLIL